VPYRRPCPGRIRAKLARSCRISSAIAFSSSEKAEPHTITLSESGRAAART
jgi:hypothetical protein